ncbi:hypothetical protein CHUAL_003132 [Chamberlinius hualienensis]
MYVEKLVNMFKSGLWLPVVLPFFLYQVIFSWHLRSAKRNKLQDKVVLITGANSGLGEALAHVFYNAGCKVILAARRIDQLERVQGELLASEPPVVCHHPVILSLDLSELKSIEEKTNEALKFHGRVDILVNNSGISSRGTAMDTAIDVDLRLMVVNYLGHIALTKCLLRSMQRQQSGHIVAVNSIQGKIAIPYRSSYAASKHAMSAFFDCLRAEVSADNIKVTVAYPGYINTNLSINAMKEDGTKHGVMDSTIAGGVSSKVAAERIVSAIVRGESEVYVATLTNRLAIYLRHLCPSLFFYLMTKRATNHKD